MLTAMRSKAGGIVAKLFIGLLAASFAVWGVSDVFRGSRSETLVSVGDTEISVGDFQREFRLQLNRLAQRLGKGVTPDEARQLGLDRQILSNLIQNAALDAQAERLKMSLPASYIARRVAAMPQFKGLTGGFDVNKFRRLLANAGLSEEQFVEEERRNLMRSGILSAVSTGLSAPETLVRIVFQHRNEARDVQYFIVPAKGIKVDEPNVSELKAFYDKNKNLFAVPERRQLTVLSALPADLKAQVEISEQDVREYYDRHKDSFGAPEKRTVEQVAFKDEKEAQAAREKIAAGKTLADIAKEKGLTASDMKLGVFTRKTFPDPKLADAIFSLKEGEVSKPLKGSLSIVLALVTKVEPGHAKTFEEVKDEIADRLRLEKAKDLALELHDKVEDARAGGQSLADIAKEMKLKRLDTPYISRDGRDEAGKRVDLPAAQSLLKAAFESDVGVDNDVITTPDDGFVWFELRDIRSANTEPFDKVRDKVAKAWKERKQREMVLKKARELKRRAEAGEDFAKLAQETGSEVKTLTQVKRNDASDDFDTAAVRALFSAPADGYAVAPGSGGVSARVIKSIPLTPPEFDPKSAEARSIRQVLVQSMSGDVAAQYLSALQGELGVKVNATLWRQVSGRTLQ